MPVCKLEITLVRYLQGCRERVEVFGEQRRHFVVTLHIVIVGRKTHTRRIVVTALRLNAKKNVVRQRVAFIYIMHVVGNDRFYAEFFCVNAKILIDF